MPHNIPIQQTLLLSTLYKLGHSDPGKLNCLSKITGGSLETLVLIIVLCDHHTSSLGRIKMIKEINNFFQMFLKLSNYLFKLLLHRNYIYIKHFKMELFEFFFFFFLSGFLHFQIPSKSENEKKNDSRAFKNILESLTWHKFSSFA